MKVLMVHPHDVRYFPWTIRMIKLAEEINALGHQVQVAFVEHKRADEPDFPKLRELPDGNVEYIPLRSRDKQTHKNIQTIIGLAKSVDLLHFQKCFPSAFIPCLWGAWRWNKPLHYDWDDNETLILQQIKNLPKGFYTQAGFFEKRIPQYVDTVSYASDRLGEICESYGFPRNRMGKVAVGADLEAFHPHRDGSSVRHQQPLQVGDRPIVAYIGQLEGAAYGSLYLKACQLLVDRYPEVVWMVVGGGDLLTDLEEQAYQMNLSHRLVFTGYMESSRIPDVLAATDIAVACFADEEFVKCKSPLKVAEYLAAGKAIVASNVGEVPWMTGDAAVLVQPGSAESLAAGISELLDDPERRKELGKKARWRAENIVNWKESARSLEKLYEIALSGHPES